MVVKPHFQTGMESGNETLFGTWPCNIGSMLMLQNVVVTGDCKWASKLSIKGAL